jgi:tetratricopeptide (TPR) repeat protein
MKSSAIKKSTSQKLIFTLLCILLFYPPFFRGLFFQKELIPTHIITAVVFITYYITNRKQGIDYKFSWIEIGLLSMTLLYTISTFFAANIELSIQETLKYINYLLILILAKRLINDKQRLKIALTILVTAGVLVVFIGVGTALETFKYNGAFVGGMMNSTLQYHNTFGAYTLAILFLAYMLAGNFQSKEKYAISIATFVLFFGFIMSYSRGAWIILPLVGFVYYILVSVEYKISFIAHLLGNLVGLAVIIKKFNSILQTSGKASGWLWLLIGIVISVAVSTLLERFLKKLNLNKKVYNIIIPVATVLMPVIVLLFKNTILGFLPKDLAERLGSISLKAETVTERAVFYKDAFKIIKDNPIIGAGGGGWETLYKAYQTYAYWSNEAHNYFMQLWIEIGTLGIVIFGLILALYLYKVFIIHKNTDDLELKNTIVGILAAVATILIHSAIDFDLSLAAIAIVLWSLIGMTLGISRDMKELKISISSKINYVVIVFSVVLLAASSLNYFAANAASKGIQLVQSKQIQQGKEKFKLASTLNPFSPNYLADYANLSNALAREDKNAKGIKESIEIMDEAVKLGKYNFKLLSNAIKFYLKNGQIDRSIDIINSLEKYHPLNSATYENKSSLLMALADYRLKNGDIEEAIKHLEDIVKIENKIKSLNDNIKNNVEMNSMVRFVKITPKTQENINKAKKLLSEIKG